MRWMRVIGVVLLVTASSAQEELPWWRTANIYQVYPRSFKDSDGDGVGDLKGIAQKASYFKEIGIDAIWISPFYKSPMVDFGYDVSDFRAIDPMFGTMDDFTMLVKTLQDLGIKLIVDFVPNHTSDQHPWFQNSLAKNGSYTDYYVWADGGIDPKSGNHTPPNNWQSRWGGSAWTWSDARQQFYYHKYLEEQPDLNYFNPKVVQEMEDVLTYWMNLGVDGFRVDASSSIFETKDLSLNEPQLPGATGWSYFDLNHIYTKNQPETYALFEQWGQLLYNHSTAPSGKPRMMVLEVSASLNDTIKYYGQGNMSFVLPLNTNLLLQAANRGSRAPDYMKTINTWVEAMPASSVPNWMIGDHDTMRVATGSGPEFADALNLLSGVLPGIKATYNGEEIGMQNTFIRWDQTKDPSGRILGPNHYQEASRDPQRTPFQWDDTTCAGFSSNSTSWLPVNPNYWWLNVAAQKTADSSHLKVYQAMAHTRKDPVLQRGDLKILTPNNDTLIIIRSYSGSYFVLVINLASETQTLTSQSLFAPNGLDIDMEVVVTSTNVNSCKVRDVLRSKALSLTLRPKSAVLLKSPPTASSSAVRLMISLQLFAIVTAFLYI